MPIDFEGPIVTMRMVRDPAWYERHRMPVAADGTMPFARYVIRQRGKVEVGNVGCAMCHTRVMPDGIAVLGAQGNFPFDAVFAAEIPSLPPPVIPFLLNSPTAAP